MAAPFFLSFLFFLFVNNSSSFVQAQDISTTSTIPPLQWINLSNLLQGNARPPPLRDAVMGYDEVSRSLIIFGGTSESGLPQSQTFLLNLQTLTWTTPSPPSTLQQIPPARSAALSGVDSAASNRNGFLVIGGKGADGRALSDVWEFDFTNEFWSEVKLSSGGPSARWGASGGIDPRTPFISDPILPGPNNTFYLAGGFDGKSVNPLSDVWRLNISGTLSSNLPDNVQGTWERLPLSTSPLPGRVDQGGAVISTDIIAVGGCNATASPSATNASCAVQDSFIIDTNSLSAIAPTGCPAPRVAPVLIPNLNTFSPSFSSQLFVLLGSFNQSLWQDSNGLAQGETAILDINTKTWTRLLPAGDPGSSGTPRFPNAREGASGISFKEALVGNSRDISSDTIIYGGQDANGNFLSDVWLLRAYNGVITPSNPRWAGFGDGNLRTGVNADGSGVLVKYLSECASLIPQKGGSKPPPSGGDGNGGNNSNPSTGTGSNDGSGSVQGNEVFNTSFIHKLLAPLSLGLLLPTVLFFRWTHVSTERKWIPNQHVLLLSTFSVLGVLAYVVGIIGFVLSFTTISSQSDVNHKHLQTTHGLVGLVFFLCLYVIVPLLYLLYFFYGLVGAYDDNRSQRMYIDRANSVDTNEKADSGTPIPRSDTPSMQNTSPPASPRPRTLSWDASYMLRPSNDGVASSESPSPTPHKGFEVLNRPGRRRRNISDPWSSTSHGAPYNLPTTRSLGEIDWLLRRRSLNAVGELDYAITQAHNAQINSNTSGSNISPAVFIPMIMYPPRYVMISRILIQLSILGLAGLTLAQLWLRSPRYAFVVFLLWVLAYCVILVVLSYHQRPASSILTVFLWNLGGKPPPSIPLENISDRDRASMPPAGPYAHHRAPFHLHPHTDETYSHNHALSVNTDDNDDDDLDEDTRQRLIEEEMARREVSIVTVPRRKLLITNPS